MIERLTYQWARLPQVEREIGGWDPDEQVAFIIEWPVHERNLRTLDDLVASGRLAADQLRRYESLKCLVDQHRPIIGRLHEL